MEAFFPWLTCLKKLEFIRIDDEWRRYNALRESSKLKHLTKMERIKESPQHFYYTVYQEKFIVLKD